MRKIRFKKVQAGQIIFTIDSYPEVIDCDEYPRLMKRIRTIAELGFKSKVTRVFKKVAILYAEWLKDKDNPTDSRFTWGDPDFEEILQYIRGSKQEARLLRVVEKISRDLIDNHENDGWYYQKAVSDLEKTTRRLSELGIECES